MTTPTFATFLSAGSAAALVVVLATFWWRGRTWRSIYREADQRRKWHQAYSRKGEAR